MIKSWRTILLALVALGAMYAQFTGPSITTTSPLPEAVRLQSYPTLQLQVSGGNGFNTWFLGEGSDLPSGLVFTSGGAITGTSVTAAPGLYSFGVYVESGEQQSFKDFQVRVRSNVVVTPATLPDGTRGISYTTSVSATGGTGPYVWHVVDGVLPPGLQLNQNTGLISGIPTTAGSYPFSMTAMDAQEIESEPRAFQIIIHQIPLTIPPTTLGRGVINVPYSAQLMAQGGSGGSYLWTIRPGGTGLPNNLTLSSAGVITGTPVQAGTFTFRARVNDFSSFEPQSQEADYTLVINPLLVITNTALPNGAIDAPYPNVQFTATGGQQPITNWSIISGTLPPGLTLSPSGLLSGTPTAVGTFPIVVQAIDSGVGQVRQVKTRDFSILVENLDPVITTTSLPQAQAQTSYVASLSATGGTPPYTFTIVSGSLPSGFVMTSAGQFLGSSANAASSSFIVRVTDSRGRFSQKAFALIVSAPDRPQLNLEIVNDSLPEGTVGKLYAVSLSARNGEPPYTWGIGGLAPGLEGSESGDIIGTPTRAGTFPVQVSVADSAGKRVTKSLNLVIKAGSIVITTERVPEGRVGQGYSTTFVATGGVAPYRFGIADGSAPPGLSLSSSGALSGTPTEAGTFPFTVQATDATGAVGVRSFTAVILPGPLTITTTALGNGTLNVAYSSSLAASGGRLPYRWSVSGLPAGLTANTSTGAITGTPTEAGTFTVGAQVTDADQTTVSKSFTLEITGPLTITTTSVGNFVAGTTVSASLAASGGRPPYSWSLTGGSLPGGVSLGGDGAITGTPTAAGPFTFTAQVRDQNNQTATRSFSGQVVTQLVITTQSAPAGQIGTSYSLALAATGGTPPYSWSATGNLPPGLSVDAAGSIGGTPTAAGTFNFTVAVRDASTPAQTAQRALSITVGLPQVSGLTIGLPTNPQPQQQPPITVAIDRVFPAEITGTLTLTFTPNAANNADDPFIQFSTGGRSVPFTIPAGQTQAAFRVPELAVQTGTTAGTITLTSALLSGGSPVDCNCQLTRTIVIPRGAPVITSVRLQRSGTSFTVTVSGFSTSREVTQGAFRFTGTNLQTTELIVPLTGPFNSWFQSTPSQQFGGQFTLSLPFTTQGESSSVNGVTVILTNGAGNSQPVTATF